MRTLTAIILATVLGAAAVAAADGDVSIAGRVVLRIRYPAAGYTVAQRADAVQVRLNDILTAAAITPSDVKVGTLNKETAVMVRDQIVITVDWTTARANGTTPRRLGEIWASNLRKALPEEQPRGINRL